MPDEVHVHIHLPEMSALMQALTAIKTTLQEGFTAMSEAADALTLAVTDAASKIDTLTASLQAEIQQITDALTNAAGDPSLTAAAADAVTRLGVISAKLDELNTTVQGIIP